MSKVTVARCAFILLALSMLAASGTDKTATNNALGFEITFPEAWTVDEKIQGEVVLSGASSTVAGAKSHAVLRVDVMYVEEGTTAKVFADSKMKDYESWDREVVEKNDVKLGGSNAYKTVFLGAWSGHNRNLRYELYFVVSGKCGYRITLFAFKDDYAKYAKDIDAIVKSFKLLETK